MGFYWDAKNILALEFGIYLGQASRIYWSPYICPGSIKWWAGKKNI